MTAERLLPDNTLGGEFVWSRQTWEENLFISDLHHVYVAFYNKYFSSKSSTVFNINKIQASDHLENITLNRHLPNSDWFFEKAF